MPHTVEPGGSPPHWLPQKKSSQATCLFVCPHLTALLPCPCCQLYNRWHATLRCARRVGEWTTAEELLLAAAVQEVGKNWALVEQKVPGRTQKQCRWGAFHSCRWDGWVTSV